MLKAIKVLQGRAAEGAPKGAPKPEMHLCDGVIVFVNYDEDGGADEMAVGVNSIVDDAIFTGYEYDKDEAVLTVKYVNRAMEEKAVEFPLAKGNRRGIIHTMEELRKGKQTVIVTSLDRKTKLFRRLRNDVKPL